MRKSIILILLLLMATALSASAFENWILACSDNAIQVSADGLVAAESSFLAECDSLWTAILSHLEPWDDAFFNSRPNPVVLHEGVYLVEVEFSGPQMTPGVISVVGIGFATHAGEMLMQNSFLDTSTSSVLWTDGPGTMRQTVEPYCFRIAAADLMEELDAYRAQLSVVLTVDEASFQAREALRVIRSTYDRYLQRNGSLQGFTIAAAVNLAGLDENTLRTWQFSVMTNVGTNVPIRYVASCIREEAPYHGKKVWYDAMEAKFHGLGIDNAEWMY